MTVLTDDERMTDERLAEIERRRLRTPTGMMPDGLTTPPLPADSALSDELLQALKAERAEAERLRGRKEFWKDETTCLRDDLTATNARLFAAEQEVERLRHGDYRRWNVEEWEHGVRVCRGDHDRSTACEWELFWKAPDPRLTRLVEGLDGLPRITVSALRGAVCDYKDIQALIKDARGE